MCSKQVRDWLVLLTMEQYVHCLLERGYMTIAQCQKIINSDLIMLGIDDQTHRKLLLDGVQLLNNSPNLFACTEPCEMHSTNQEQSDVNETLMDACKAKSKPMSSITVKNLAVDPNPLPFIAVPDIETDELFELTINDLLDLDLPIDNLPKIKNKSNKPTRIDQDIIVID